MATLVERSRVFAANAAKTLIPASRAGVWALAEGSRLISALPAGINQALAKLNPNGARLFDSMNIREYQP